MVDDLPEFGVPRGFHQDPGKVAALKGKLFDEGVKSCLATFVDIHGIPKSKVTPLETIS